MFDRLGRAVAHHPVITIVVWSVLAVGSLAMALFGVGGQGIFDRVTSGAPTIPGSQSQKGQQIIDDRAETGPSLTLIVSGVNLDDAATVDKLNDQLQPIRASLEKIPGVLSPVIDPLALPEGLNNPAAASMVATDHQGFLIVVDLKKGLSQQAQNDAVAAVQTQLESVPRQLASSFPGISGQVGGTPLIADEIVGQVKQDLETGEIVSIPVALIVMILVFAGFLAACMPLAGALASIAVGLGTLLGYSYLMDLDSSVINVVTVLALGLSIDYGLLVVSRFREELHAGAGDGPTSQEDVRAALRRTMATAGRTVAFSALTVAVSIAGLAVFRSDILRAFGLSGLTIVLIAVLSAITLVPAILTLVGRRMIKPSLIARIPWAKTMYERFGDTAPPTGFFSKLAGRVQRHPILITLGVVAVLVVLASPITDISFRNSTVELLPASADQRTFLDTLQKQYPYTVQAPITIVAESDVDDVAAWSQQLSSIDNVAKVQQPIPENGYCAVGVFPADGDPGGAQAEQIVHDIRDLKAPFPTYVTGQAANQVDFNASLAQGAPWAALIVVLATFILLFLMTGSLLIPLKALIINVLSLCASLGIVTWIFEDGHLSHFLDFTAIGGIESYVVVLVMCFGFGLAMDYEVFLISRIKEAYDAGAPNELAVRMGLQRSGRIITSAALTIIVVFIGFVAGKLIVIKEVGVALAVTVLVDATLVRMLLVPATMTLLRKWNWWAPKPLRKLYSRFSIMH